MRLLLDTHILLWSMTASPLTPDRGRQLVTDPANALYCSAASIWEVGIKHAKGGDIPMSGADLLEALRPLNIQILAVTGEHAAAAGLLPRHHGDPFDRMLIVQAKAEGMTLLTSDGQLAAYGDFVMVV